MPPPVSSPGSRIVNGALVEPRTPTVNKSQTPGPYTPPILAWSRQTQPLHKRKLLMISAFVTCGSVLFCGIMAQLSLLDGADANGSRPGGQSLRGEGLIQVLKSSRRLGSCERTCTRVPKAYLTNACCLLYAPIMGAQRMGRRHSEMRFRDVETRTPTHFLLEPCCGNLGSSWAV